MARNRLAGLAAVDLAHILATSEERWGTDGRRRYATILAAMRNVAAEPQGPTTRERADLLPGIRSPAVSTFVTRAAAARTDRQDGRSTFSTTARSRPA
jgi:hypothetical protein